MLCAVNGLCVGGGLHFVVDADIVLASENAAFMDTHVNVGMVGALENIGLAKRLPLGAALRMTLLGRHYRMPARRAYELGLVDELVATPADLRAGARGDAARRSVRNSPQAMALSKQAVWGSLERGYGDALERGWALLRSHWTPSGLRRGPARLRREARAALEPRSGRARRRAGGVVRARFSADEEAFRAEVRAFLADWSDDARRLLPHGNALGARDGVLPRARRARLALARLAGPRPGAGALARFEYILWDEVAYARAARAPLDAGIVAKSIARYGERRHSRPSGCRASGAASAASRSATRSPRRAPISRACARAPSATATPTS